jgi:hypothetical protein
LRSRLAARCDFGVEAKDRLFDVDYDAEQASSSSDQPPRALGVPVTEAAGVKSNVKATPFVSRFPVIYDAAEHIVRGYLQRRNILTFLPPRGYEGYDLLAVHPDPRRTRRTVRIQVKSRMATDSGSFTIKPSTFRAVDYFAFVVMGLGEHFHGIRRAIKPEPHPTIYIVPALVARRASAPGWGRGNRILLSPRHRNAWRKYQDSHGVELVAKDLGVPFPVPKRLRHRQGKDS